MVLTKSLCIKVGSIFFHHLHLEVIRENPTLKTTISSLAASFPLDLGKNAPQMPNSQSFPIQSPIDEISAGAISSSAEKPPMVYSYLPPGWNLDALNIFHSKPEQSMHLHLTKINPKPRWNSTLQRKQVKASYVILTEALKKTNPTPVPTNHNHPFQWAQKHHPFITDKIGQSSLLDTLDSFHSRFFRSDTPSQSKL